MSYSNNNPLWRRPRSKWLLGIPVGGFLAFVVGAVFIVGSNAAIHATGTNEFCATACHSHERFIAPEWKASVHYVNASGFVAGCADCHIPNEYPDKLLVKAKAGLRDGYNEFIVGSLDTREKFEARRAEMAKNIWKQLKANDSKPCRSCHTVESFQGQSERAQKMHKVLAKGKRTCIDCHKGVAHLTPAQARKKYGVPGETSD